MTPVGEYIRYVVLTRLASGPASVEELNDLVKAAVERTRLRFDWRIWPQLLVREVAIENGVARLTEHGRWLVAIGLKVMENYVKQWWP